MKSVTINGFSDYELYEDGRVWSRIQCKFLRPYRGRVQLRKNNTSYWFTVNKLMKEHNLLWLAPDIDGLKHTTFLFDSAYQVYSNGSIWSRKHKKFLSHVNRNGHNSLLIAGKYYNIDELVYSHFVGPVKKGYHIKHKDGDLSNDKLSNLELIKNEPESIEVENNNTKKGIKNMNVQAKTTTDQIEQAMQEFRKEQIKKLNEFEANLYKKKLIELFRENESEEVIAEIVKVANTYFAKLHCCNFDDDSVQKITNKIWYYGLREYFDSEIYGEI